MTDIENLYERYAGDVRRYWFATRGVRGGNPQVIQDVREGLAVPLSDHDAIGVDIGAFR